MRQAALSKLLRENPTGSHSSTVRSLPLSQAIEDVSHKCHCSQLRSELFLLAMRNAAKLLRINRQAKLAALLTPGQKPIITEDK